MSGSRRFAALVRHATGMSAATRNTLIAVGACLACLVVVLALGDMMGRPTNADLAAALATGG